MSTNFKDQILKSDPVEIILDPRSHKRYQKGKFLGKGGFAKCYELTDIQHPKQVLAGKIVSKTLLVKEHQKSKMTQEITIHRSLHHKHIVGFHGYFEDSNNVYIILELCRKRSLMELHKRRKAITEPETRYFLKHLLLGVKHLHDQNVIHRDLKLGNLFINDEMELKIGDFGLATKVHHEGERKKTLCGTPNYIAPEILCKEGHSFEVDVWSIGCILYTLLVGRPPFETQTLKDTYSKIKKNEYSIPHRVGATAKSLIQRLLHAKPSKRPSVDQILEDDFMTKGYLPIRLPTSCLTTAPRFDAHSNANALSRKPLIDINARDASAMGAGQKDVKKDEAAGLECPPSSNRGSEGSESSETRSRQDANNIYLRDLLTQVTSLIASKPDQINNIQQDEAEDPAAMPMLWVSKWVDYSDKYGLGYQLSDDSIGVFFNDFTKLLLLADGKSIHYVERNGTEHYHSLEKYPKDLFKKVTLLSYFKSYMKEHLLKAGASMVPRDGDELIRIPSLKTYFRTKSAIILQLTNGTFQINFFDDHTKIILCPLMGAVTYIDKNKSFRTFKLSLLQEHGCSDDLLQRLRYAKSMIQKLTMMKSSTSSVASKSETADRGLAEARAKAAH